MNYVADELMSIVKDFTEKVSDLSEADFNAKPLPHKWSKKEVLGHLIDSAHNNFRRFVVGQYESMPSKIVYDQDFWVRSNDYQHMDGRDVIVLWRLMNARIAAVLKSMPVENYMKAVDTGKEGESLRTLEWLAEDYVRHMKHHLNQIVPDSFDMINS